MKKQMKTPAMNVRSTFRRAAFIALFAAGSFSALQAQNAPTTTTGDAQIRYTGTVNGKLIFEVDYSNETVAPFTLEIKDAEGYVFYNNRFKEKSFKKFFALDKEELYKTSITIQLATKNTVQKQVFDITTSTKTVDEVSVVKL